MNLVPEKRLDKTGKLVTRHVRATSSDAAAAKGIPAPAAAPSAPSKAPKAGKFKLRPSQLQKSRYREYSAAMFLSPELREDPNIFRSKPCVFEANDVEVFSVLAVSYDSNAMKLLNDGVRTTEEARTYLVQRGLEPPYDRTELVQEMLRRNITVSQYRKFFNTSNLPSSMENSPYLADAIELFSSASLNEQYHYVFRELLDGSIRLSDIKRLGYTKLKPYDRLRNSAEALCRVNDPDAKFTIDDMKSVLDNYHGTGTSNQYNVLLNYLVHSGPEFVNSVNKYALYAMDRGYTYLSGDKRVERVTYHMAMQGEHGTYFRADQIETLQKAGVDPVRAGDLIRSGMEVRDVINVITEDLPTGLGEGWL